MPALRDLALLELAAIMLDEMLKARIDALRHGVLLEVWVVHGGWVPVKQGRSLWAV